MHIVMLERFLRAYIMCSAFVKFPITFSIFIYIIVCVMLVTSALLAAEQALYKMIPIIVIVDTTDRSH